MVNGNPKRVFWEALILTVAIFLVGLLLGVVFEEKRVQVAEDYYSNSEIALMDVLALNNLYDIENVSCDVLVKSNLNFADQIYQEAKLLEMFEEKGRLRENIEITHKRYDIMRTLLWMNVMKTNEQCGSDGVDYVVYLYNLDTEDLTERAKQGVWSKILSELKAVKGDELVLIPIAKDQELTTLDSLATNYEIESDVALIINGEYVVTELSSVEDLEQYFN